MSATSEAIKVEPIEVEAIKLPERPRFIAQVCCRMSTGKGFFWWRTDAFRTAEEAYASAASSSSGDQSPPLLHTIRVYELIDAALDAAGKVENANKPQ